MEAARKRKHADDEDEGKQGNENQDGQDDSKSSKRQKIASSSSSITATTEQADNDKKDKCPDNLTDAKAIQQWWRRRLDDERIEFVVKKRKAVLDASSTMSKKKEHTEEERQLLIATFDWVLRKHADYRQTGEPAKPPTQKQWRPVRPDPETEYRWRRVQQNSKEWAQIREGSSGASSLLQCMGWDSYVSLAHRWSEDCGLVGLEAQSVEKMFACDVGHRDEDLCRRLSEIVTGAHIQETGVWLHPDMPHAHASPDGNPEYADERVPVLLNKYTLWDSLRGLWENKITMHCALINNMKKGELWGCVHAIRPYHVIQMQGQMACVSKLTEWSDYTSFWKFSERFPLVRISKDEPLASPHVGLAREAAQRSGCFKCGEMLMSRCYANRKLAEFIFCQLNRYIRSVKRRTPLDKVPYHISPKDMTVKWLPLAHVVWYIDGCPRHIWDTPQVFDPAPILAYENHPQKDKPIDWVGHFPPTRRVAIHVCYDVRPMNMTLEEFADMI